MGVGGSNKCRSCVGGSICNRTKRSVIAKTFKNSGTDIEEAAVKLEVAAPGRRFDPRKGQQIRQRKPDRLMFAKVLPLFGRHRHGMAQSGFGVAITA